jgi:hypothetical protein
MLLMLVPLDVARRDGVMPTKLMQELFTCAVQNAQSDGQASTLFTELEPRFIVSESFAMAIAEQVQLRNSTMLPCVRLRQPPVELGVSLLEMRIPSTKHRHAHKVLAGLLDMMGELGLVNTEQAIGASVTALKGTGVGETDTHDAGTAIVIHVFGTCQQHISAKKQIFRVIQIRQSRVQQKISQYNPAEAVQRKEWKKLKAHASALNLLASLCEDPDSLHPCHNYFKPSEYQKPVAIKYYRGAIHIGFTDFCIVRYATDPSVPK